MGMKCLGKVNIDPAIWEVMLDKDFMTISAYFNLGKDDYVPLSESNEVENTNENCKRIYEESKEKPKVVGKVKERAMAGHETTISNEMLDRLWLYDGKIYEESRNDYNEEEVELLIFQCIDRQKDKFDKLRNEYKEKP